MVQHFCKKKKTTVYNFWVFSFCIILKKQIMRDLVGLCGPRLPPGAPRYFDGRVIGENYSPEVQPQCCSLRVILQR